MKIAIGVEYDGSSFSGWQRQRHARSVQGALEVALSRVAGCALTLHCAGRTDAGVHAIQQVAHFESRVERAEKAWVMGGNSYLPEAVAVLWARPVDEDFHARHSAEGRRYRYVIDNRRQRPALLHGRVGWVYQPLDTELMQRAAQALIGEHDFSAFRAAGCQARHARRCVHAIELSRDGDFVYLDIAANAFLHNMVRIITGTLIAVGHGERPVDWLGELLAGRDRRAAAATAPPGGLYFVGPSYPQRFALPVASRLPTF